MPGPVFLILGLAIAGCAIGARWSKPGVDSDAARADFAQCQGLANDATLHDSGIDADILASRGQDWSNQGTLGVHRAAMTAMAYGRADAVLDQCMASKGYTRQR
ncbi:MAG TPA: hypothetical protein VL993_18415 [Stellaceae bacterium]|nr:hypothetical protein [Stellaceae bacterium]